MIEIIILSIIQGITEFLPISSSAHLILVSKYLNLDIGNLTLDVSLHLGSLLAILMYFKNEVFNFAKSKKLIFKIILSSLPLIIFGFFLIKLDLIYHLRNLKIIGWTTIVFGIFLYYCDKFKTKKKLNKDFNYSTAIFIGLFQILALIPGVSRSGIVMSAGRFFNFNRVDSAKIAFLLSIPALAGASLFNIKNLIAENDFNISIVNLSGVFLSFLFSYMTIKFLIKFLQRFSLTSFAVYRVILGLIILTFAY